MQVRIATLNVWALPEPLAPAVALRMGAIAERLSDLDLDAIAFQEVWTPDARRLLVAGGRRARLDQVWHREASFGGSGLLILSRLPIEAVRFERFELQGVPQGTRHIDSLGGKGFARVRLRTPAGPLSLIDTHLHARYSHDVSHQYLSVRTGQAVQLAMGAWATREPIAAVGDFNFVEGTPEYRVLTGLTGLRDVAAALDRREPTIYAEQPYRLDSRAAARRVDLVFARDGVERGLVPRRVERVFDEIFEVDGAPGSYSNHAGVLAELEIAPQPSGPIGQPDAEAVALASRLLAEGRAEAERLRRDGRALAGMGFGAVGLSALGVRSWCTTRRRLLRFSLTGAAMAVFAPSVAYSMLTELSVPNHIAAFDRLQRRLLQVAGAGGQKRVG